MSNNEDPINAPVPGRPREADELRLARSFSIDARSNRSIDINLTRLRKAEPNATAGRVIDRMAIFCAANGFDVLNPEKRPTKKPAPVSTPAPAHNHKALPASHTTYYLND